jgi:hypothetical protein
MRRAVPLVCVLLLTGCGGGSRIRAHGVRLTLPHGWHRVAPAADSIVQDPRTLLVAGTAGVAAKPQRCQIAAYDVQPRGAVVVVVGWKSVASGGGRPSPGRAPLDRLVSVRRPSFECFSGRGAAATVLLGGRLYQVNVMIGDRAAPRVVAQALRVGRSFDRSR